MNIRKHILACATTTLLAITMLAAPAAASPTAGASGDEAIQQNPFPGGSPILVNGTARCNSGFNVSRGAATGFISVGYCGQAGDSVSTIDGEPLAVVEGSTFPGSGYMWARFTGGWTPAPEVLPGTPITDGDPAPVNSPACMYPGTGSGVQCGIITGRNLTINYGGVVFTGVISTNICIDGPGLGGTPLVAGTSAQGLLIGGSGNCTTGGTTYFLDVRRGLTEYGLTLVTS